MDTDPGWPQLRVLIPQESIRSVIGDRGTTIGSIAKSSGTYMNVSREPWQSSTSRVLTVASRSASANVVGAVGEALRIAYGNGDALPEALNIVIILPVRLGPLIVGRGGSRVTELQQKTQCFVSLKRPPPGVDEEEMFVQGSFDGISAVLEAVSEAYTAGSMDAVPPRVTRGMENPHEHLRESAREHPREHSREHHPRDHPREHFRESAREHVRESLREQHEQREMRERAPERSRGSYSMTAHSGGSDDVAARDRRRVDEDVQECESFLKMQLPSGLHVGSFIGKGGSFMRQLHQESRASKLHIEDASDGRWLEIQGTLGQVQIVLTMMTRKLLELHSATHH